MRNNKLKVYWLLMLSVMLPASVYPLYKRNLFSKFIPSIASSSVTLCMYIGEMCLLSSSLYRFGAGFLFSGIPGISLAPIDIIVILAAGVITYLLLTLANKPKNHLSIIILFQDSKKRMIP